MYSIKSGYHRALNFKFSKLPTGSKRGLQGWHKIWRLDLPEKIKIFLWRTVRNLLTTADNLWKRKVMQEPICQMCKAKCEDIFHALMECKVARKI